MNQTVAALGLVSLFVAACGGGTSGGTESDTAGPPGATPSATGFSPSPLAAASAGALSMPGRPRLALQATEPAWTFVANEWQTFLLTQPGTVRYGASGVWIEAALPAGQHGCSNTAFGRDPLPGVGKRCELSAPGSSSGTWVATANEWASFVLAAPRRVRYGAQARWLERDLPAGQVSCTNAFFGDDPLPGVVKGCEVWDDSGAPSEWTFLADEWGAFSLASPGTVRYGASGTWIERSLSAGQGACTNSFFGADPFPGVVKRCEVRNNGTPPPPPPPPPPPTAGVTFYDDAVLDTWSDGSWNANVDTASRAVPAASGNVNAAVSFTNAWGAFALANWNTPVSTAGFNAITVSVRGSVSPRYLELFVEGANGSGRASAPLPDVQPGVWQDVVVYLADLGLPGAIHRIGLISDSTRLDYTNANTPEFTSTFYVDKLRLALVTPPPAPPAQAGPALQVNAAAGQRAISPGIYGLNYDNQAAFAAEIGLPVNRWGGDGTPRFNYQTNNSNPGFNWYFENRLEDTTPTQFIDFNRRAAGQTVMTLPMIGWAAKDATSCGFSIALYGAQSGQAPDRTDCGTGLTPAFSEIATSAATDTSIATTAAFYRPWVQSIVAAYGRADQGGVRWWNLDNEPGIWHSTHRDVVKQGVTHTDLLARSIAAASMLKSVDPSAQTLGPSEDGWTRYLISGRDSQLGNWSATYDGLWAVQWYLKEMRLHEQRSGQRLLDYLDLHYYPQAAGVYGAAGSKATQALRLRTVRSLWDSSYQDESWIGTTGVSAVNLIGRMREWTATHYPGTKLAITEYNFGALNHINGALTQADVLGVFGREGLDLATLWGPPASWAGDTGLFTDKPGAYAFRMYRNYDGAGGRFGDISVASTSADQGRLSVYGSIDSADGSLKIIVINKTETPLTSRVALSGFNAAGPVNLYRYASANLSAIERETLTVSGNTVTNTFAAQSITMLHVRRQ